MTQVNIDSRTVPLLFGEEGDTPGIPCAATPLDFWYDGVAVGDEGYAPLRPARTTAWGAPDTLEEWWEA